MKYRYKNISKTFFVFAFFIPSLITANLITLDPSELVNRFNIDVIPKYIYAQFYTKKIQSDWGHKLYTEYFKSMEVPENTIEIQLNEFHMILDNVKKNNVNKVPVIISSDYKIIEGSNYVAASLVYKKEVICQIDDSVDICRQETLNERKEILSQKYLDAIAYEYLKLNKNARIAIVWPRALDKLDWIKEKLSACCSFVYEKMSTLKNSGPKTFLEHIRDKRPYLNRVLNEYFPPEFEKPYEIVVLVFDVTKSMKEVTWWKNHLRKLIGISFWSFHINDTPEHSIEVAKMVLNENSIQFMNQRRENPDKLENFEKLITIYQNYLVDNQLDIDTFCIDGGGVLAAYGLRDVPDLDFIHFGGKYNIALHIDSHNWFYRTDVMKNISKDDIIYNPEKYFYFSNLKFQTLDITKAYKKRRARSKDVRDVQLIEAFNLAMR